MTINMIHTPVPVLINVYTVPEPVPKKKYYSTLKTIGKNEAKWAKEVPTKIDHYMGQTTGLR